MTGPAANLTEDLAEIDVLVQKGTITKERGEAWKSRIIAKFETDTIPPEPKKEMPKDLAHFPGRLVEAGVNATKNILSHTANVGPNIERMERDMQDKGVISKDSKKKPQTPDDLLKNLPDKFK